MKVPQLLVIILAPISLALPACQTHHGEDQAHEEQHKIVITSPMAKDVTITQPYVCQIRSQKNIEVCPLVSGRLEQILVKEGQLVKKGDPLFKILPTLYQAKLDAELAKVRTAQIKLENTKRLYNDGKTPLVSQTEVALHQQEVAEAEATANRTKTEVEFTLIKADFDGVVDRLPKQLGSTVKEGEVLTTLYDNSVMWVYFYVPEVRYYEYKSSTGQDIECPQLELVLANANKFPHHCTALTQLPKVNNETGTCCYRADFPNPDRLLRHGQTGKMLVNRTLKNALVIPQRATFERLEKRYVFVVEKDGNEEVAHEREIVVAHEIEDVYVIKKGLDANEKIVYEGVRQVVEGQKLEALEYKKPEEVLSHLKHVAE
jgi:membrane fusion protein (multidrug efflux system)